MLLVFFRHGAAALLAIVAAALLIAGLGGVARLSPIEIRLGAMLFYLSEYGMHRFAFHAPPQRWAFVRKLQHRLHYDHHVEPNRLDLLFLPLWFLVAQSRCDGGPRRARARRVGGRLGHARRHARDSALRVGALCRAYSLLSREPGSGAG